MGFFEDQQAKRRAHIGAGVDFSFDAVGDAAAKLAKDAADQALRDADAAARAQLGLDSGQPTPSVQSTPVAPPKPRSAVIHDAIYQTLGNTLANQGTSMQNKIYVPPPVIKSVAPVKTTAPVLPWYKKPAILAGGVVALLGTLFAVGTKQGRRFLHI